MFLSSGRADRDVPVWLTFFADRTTQIIYAFARRKGVAACGLLALIVLASIPLQGFSPLFSDNEPSAAIDVATIREGRGLTGIPLSSFMPARIATAPLPPGFVSFCMRHPDQCTKEQGTATIIPLTVTHWKRLEKVNRDINWKITAKSDVEHYDRQEYWTIPEDGYGDCEDYALAKLKLLLDSGFPRGALRTRDRIDANRRAPHGPYRYHRSRGLCAGQSA